MTKTEIPPDHPRRVSLETRERIIEGQELASKIAIKMAAMLIPQVS